MALHSDRLQLYPIPEGSWECEDDSSACPSTQAFVPTLLHSSTPSRKHSRTALVLPKMTREVPPMVNITATLQMRLRGARETWQCVENDFYIPATCPCCATDMFCIMDANYFLCPLCRVVSPLQGGADEEYDGGVGLAFTVTDLQQWQHEILARRSRDHA